MKEVDGSIEVGIDALESIFELQKLKMNFVSRKNEIRFLAFVAQN